MEQRLRRCIKCYCGLCHTGGFVAELHHSETGGLVQEILGRKQMRHLNRLRVFGCGGSDLTHAGGQTLLISHLTAYVGHAVCRKQQILDSQHGIGRQKIHERYLCTLHLVHIGHHNHALLLLRRKLGIN